MLAGAQKLPGIGDGVTARDAQVSRDGQIAVARIPLSVATADDVPKSTGEKRVGKLVADTATSRRRLSEFF